MKNLLFWVGIKNGVVQFVVKYFRVLLSKSRASTPSWTFMQPHNILKLKWEVISMDFVVITPKVKKE